MHFFIQSVVGNGTVLFLHCCWKTVLEMIDEVDAMGFLPNGTILTCLNLIPKKTAEEKVRKAKAITHYWCI